ncbi:MAG: DUF2975 domain-containing protein [Microbacteriaceae bacterium]|nr:DUF2975 domain-containing protein [Microbacteriaceae bacterium]
MSRPLEYLLKTLLVILVLAIAVIQALVLPALAYGMSWLPEQSPYDWARVTVLVAAILILACGQIALVCVWPLLTKVRRGTVFSATSFRWVNALIAAVFASAALGAALLVFLDRFGFGTPLVGIGLVILIVGGVALALLLVVMRALLRQATEQHDELAQVV